MDPIKLKADAAAYIATRFANCNDPEQAERILMPGGDRDFLLTLMAGFAADIAAKALRDLMKE